MAFNSSSNSASENNNNSFAEHERLRLASSRRLLGPSDIPEIGCAGPHSNPIRSVAKRVKSLFDGSSSSPFDIVSLNVRGRHFDLYRSLLCQVKDSQLDVVFRDEKNVPLTKDSTGRFFLDMNSSHFERIVDFLSAFQLAEQGQSTAYPSLEIEDKKMFESLVRYLDLGDVILRPDKRFCLSQTSCLIRVTDNGRTVAHKAGLESYQTAFGHSSFSTDIVQFTLKIQHLGRPSDWIFIGVIPEDSTATPSSFRTSGSFGWSSNGDAWIRGKYDIVKRGCGPRFYQGEEVMLTLDCTQGYHTLRLQVIGTSEVSEIPFLPKKSWRLQVVLYGQNDELQIIDVEYPTILNRKQY